MDYEYAVDPQAIATSWDRFQNIISRFGFEQGRLISDFPHRGWSTAVRKAIAKSELGQYERTKILNKLDKAKREGKIRRFGRKRFDDISKWLQYAIEENEIRSFGKIIAQSSEVCFSNVIFVEEIDDASFKIESHVKRDIDSLLSVSDILLRFSSKIDIIDPYFRIDRPKDKNTRKLLNRFLGVAKERSGTSQFRIHFRDSIAPIEHIKENLFKQNPQKFFDFIPDKMSLEIYCWHKQEDSNLPFHDRYMLGNQGGISLGAGFEPKSGEPTTLVRLDLDDAEVIRQYFEFDGTGHQWIEPGFRIFRNRQPELIRYDDIN